MDKALSYKSLGTVLITKDPKNSYSGQISWPTCRFVPKQKKTSFGEPAREMLMIKYAVIFAVIALIAGALGFTGVAAGAASIAKVFAGLFLILAVIFIVLAALGVGASNKILK